MILIINTIQLNSQIPNVPQCTILGYLYNALWDLLDGSRYLFVLASTVISLVGVNEHVMVRFSSDSKHIVTHEKSTGQHDYFENVFTFKVLCALWRVSWKMKWTDHTNRSVRCVGAQYRQTVSLKCVDLEVFILSNRQKKCLQCTIFT